MKNTTKFIETLILDVLVIYEKVQFNVNGAKEFAKIYAPEYTKEVLTHLESINTEKKIMDTATKLKELEDKIIALGMAQLEALVEDYGQCKFKVLGKKACKEAHMEEMVKLAHRIKSLLPASAQ